MRKRMMTMLLCVSMLVATTACGANTNQINGTGERPGTEGMYEDGTTTEAGQTNGMQEQQEEPFQGVKKTMKLTEHVPEPEFAIGYTQELPRVPIMKFGWELLQNNLKNDDTGENVLLSPLSAFTVLQMAMIGAGGETRQQMLDVLHTGLNFYVAEYGRNLPSGEGFALHMANSIWYKDDGTLTVKEPFLQFNVDAFASDIYKAPFDDTTLQDINHWVSEQTDGKIEQVLDEIAPNAVAYLINALSFDAEWENIYKVTDVWNDVFIKEDGTEQLTDMLHSEENVYLESDLATGFVKYYKGGRYAFVALLPKEGMTVSEFVQQMGGETIAELLEHQQKTKVDVTMPKFSTEYSVELSDILAQMGMTDAFDEDKANFTAMAESLQGNIYINRVLQKTYLSVDEKGTSAGASTVVEMANKMALIKKEEVVLNRPFVYMVVECQYNEPLFVGTMMDVEN